MSNPAAVNVSIAEALGIPLDGVQSITLALTKDKWPTLTVVRAVKDPITDTRLADAVSEYRLVPADDPPWDRVPQGTRLVAAEMAE